MAEQKIKVRVDDLLKAVEAKKKALLAQQAEVEKQRKIEEKAHVARVVKALEAAVAAAKKGVLPDISFRRLEIRLEEEGPRYVAKVDTVRIDQDIALLKLAADETILVSTDSKWGQYL